MLKKSLTSMSHLKAAPCDIESRDGSENLPVECCSFSSIAVAKRGCVQVRGLLVSHAQVFVRIHGHVVHAHLVVQVRPGGPARLAHITNHLAATHMLSGNYSHGREMSVHSEEVVTVVEFHGSPVA